MEKLVSKYDARIKEGKAFVNIYKDAVELVMYNMSIITLFKNGSFEFNEFIGLDKLFSMTCSRYIKEFYLQYGDYFES